MASSHGQAAAPGGKVGDLGLACHRHEEVVTWREPVLLAGAGLCLCNGSRPALSRELGSRCYLWDSGEQNAGAARPPSTCGTPRGRKALMPALLCGADGDAGLGAGPPPIVWQCHRSRPGGSCAAPRLSRTLLYFKESVQNISLHVLKGERSARCILTAKYV